jgi:lysozyme family protein
MTDAVIAAIAKRAAADLIARLCDERLAFLKSLKTWSVFGAGWGRRVAEVREAALAMAVSAAAAPPVSRAQGRGVVPLPAGAQKGTAGGVIVTGAAAAHHAAQSGASLAVVIALVVAVLLVACLGWIAFHWWRKRKQEAPVAI